MSKIIGISYDLRSAVPDVWNVDDYVKSFQIVENGSGICHIVIEANMLNVGSFVLNPDCNVSYPMDRKPSVIANDDGFIIIPYYIHPVVIMNEFVIHLFPKEDNDGGCLFFSKIIATKSGDEFRNFDHFLEVFRFSKSGYLSIRNPDEERLFNSAVG